MNFDPGYVGQLSGARELLVDKKIVTLERLAMMSDADVKELINENFIVIGADSDSYILIPRDKLSEFNKIALYIYR